MIYKYDIENLDCASCAQKIEDMINKRSEVKNCTLAFASKLLMIESDEEINIDEIEKAANVIEKGVLFIPRQQKNNSSSHTCACELDNHNHEDVHKDIDRVDYEYHVEGLDCASCATKVETAICKLDEVEDASLAFSTGVLKVKVNNQENPTQVLQKTIDQIESGVKLYSKKEAPKFQKAKLFDLKENWNLVIGILVYIISIIFKENSASVYLFLVAYILIGYEIVGNAFKNIFRGEIFDENFLMVVATFGAFMIGDYPEAVAVLLFYSIGEIFQSYAVNKTRNSISSLMDIKSDYANLKDGDTSYKVAPEDVKVGDIILVKVGERVPLDGVVVEGQSTLDTSSLTGESLPRNIKENEEVLAGVVNLSELIAVKVTKPYEDSTVSKILELMENAASKKAPIEKFITKFAKVYTPSVVGLAVLLTVIPMLIFPDAVLNDWLYRSLTFLVVSCPCALVISVPLGLYAGLGKASKVGALVKGGNYLELLKSADTIVFDKTGTLTKGQFEVVEVNGEKDLLEIAAYGEYYSNHPIAKSIVSAFNETIDESRIQEFKEVAGHGIEVLIDHKTVFLGNESLFKDKNIEVSQPDQVGTIVYVAVDQKFYGSIVVADQIKEDSIEGIRLLKEKGVRHSIMLTGDHRDVAKNVGERLGIETVYSELLPQDKVSKMEEIINQSKGAVIYVGDGINDAPVLARSDIGVAMGGVGSDAAIEAADIVLMEDHIGTIAETIDISRKTNRVLKQNVIFTLFVKFSVLFLVMFGLANMWMGVFADVGVTLIAILNSMRILK